MSLAVELNAITEGLQNAPPAIKGPIIQSRDEFIASFKPENAIQVGDKFPEFRLSNAVGEEVSSADLLAEGALLITFYRGEWCPYCNLALARLQKHLDEFKAKGVTLVAISPELPNQSLSTVEKHALKFPVLTDLHNKLAKQLGIVFAMPDMLRPVFEAFGNDMKTKNGDDSLEVPVPATILVDKTGVVRNLFLDPDYTKRLETTTALEWADAL